MSFNTPSSPSLRFAADPHLPRRLAGYVAEASGFHQFWLVIASLVTVVLGTAPLELQRRIVNDALGRHEIAEIVFLALLYVALALAEGCFKLLTKIYRGWVGESATRALRVRINECILRRQAAGDGPDTNGVGLSIIIAEAEAIGGFVGDSFSEPVLQAGTLTLVLGYMIYLQPFMAVIALVVMAPQIVLVPWIQGAINEKVARRIRLLRLISVDIVSAGHGSDNPAKARAIDTIFIANMGVYRLKFTLSFLMNLMNNLGIAGILGFGGYYVSIGQIEAGTVLAFISGLHKINDPWIDLINWFRDLMLTRAKYELVVEASRL